MSFVSACCDGSQVLVTMRIKGTWRSIPTEAETLMAGTVSVSLNNYDGIKIK